MKTHIDDLSPELREEALKKFESLARAQRDVPEDMGGGGPMSVNPGKLNSSGVWLWLSEHIGDLTHRIACRRHVDSAYGITMAEPKVRTGLRMLRSPYGCEKEIDQNVENNRLYQQERDGNEIDPVKWRKDFEDATMKYAEAHEKLIVYNKVHEYARDAAVYVGLRNYQMAELCLASLKKLMDGDEWLRAAGTVYVEGGRVVPYHRGITESIRTNRNTPGQ